MGQQNRSKRTTSISIDWLETHICPKSLHKSMFFDFSGAHLEGDAASSTKCVCTRILLQNAVRMTKVIQQYVSKKIVSQEPQMV